jgi:CheY-like chemotaxis protein
MERALVKTVAWCRISHFPSFKNDPMQAAAAPARSISDYDWPAAGLGDPGGWPLSLQIAAGLLLNCPLPALLAWGPGPIVLFNEAYGALAGPGYGRVPGGAVPAVLPPPLAAAGAAFERAWKGEAALQPQAVLHFMRSGGRTDECRDLYATPVRGEDGGVAGVLCTMAPAASAPAAAEAPAGALRILVVEDNLDAQYLVCEMLRAFGHEADGVAHPSDALELLAAKRYEVLFSDVSLPGMSGVDLARKALGDRPDLKVIFASGYGDSLLRHLDFPYLSLQKPYEIDQLQEALGSIERERHG